MPLPPLSLGFLVGAGVWIPLPETSINLVPVPGVNPLPLRYFSFWATEVSSCTSQGPGCNFLVLGESRTGALVGGCGWDPVREVGKGGVLGVWEALRI